MLPAWCDENSEQLDGADLDTQDFSHFYEKGASENDTAECETLKCWNAAHWNGDNPAIITPSDTTTDF